MPQFDEIKLKAAPLIMALVQVKFSPVKLMNRYIPNLQDRLRRQSYPRFEEVPFQQLRVSMKPEFITGCRWVFGSTDKKNWVTVTDDYLVFETSDYDLFDGFSKKVETSITCLIDAMQDGTDGSEIAFVMQIGLRFINLIRGRSGHQPEWFIAAGLRGIQESEFENAAVSNQYVAVISTPEGELSVRAFNGSGNNFIPPGLDLDRHGLDSAIPSNEPYWILDIDHIWQGEFNFNQGLIQEKIRGLHRFVMNAFYAATTPEAICNWKEGN